MQLPKGYVNSKEIYKDAVYVWTEAHNAQAQSVWLQILLADVSPELVRELKAHFEALPAVPRKGIFAPKQVLSSAGYPLVLVYPALNATPLAEALRLEPGQATERWKQASELLFSLHQSVTRQNMNVHGNISLDNFLLANGQFWLSGFGYAPLLKAQHPDALRVCRDHLAPEVSSGEISPAADQFAFAKAVVSQEPRLADTDWYRRATNPDPQARFRRMREAYEELHTAAVNMPPTPSGLRVSPAGPGDYRAIQAAITAAKPGDKIHILPGVYEETLVIDKRVELVGVGKTELIRVESGEGPCLTLRADQATARNLRLHGRAGGSTQAFATVDIVRGKPLLEDCDISSEADTCVDIHGEGTDPTLKHCRIHDGKESGILVFQKARGRLTDCDIYANGYAGVEIAQGGDPVVEKCRIYDTREGSGVFVYKNGRGRLTDCDIYGNDHANIEILQNSAPVLLRCRIRQGKTGGVFIYDRGAGSLDECDISENKYVGVEMFNANRPAIRQCKITGNAFQGFWIHGRSSAIVEHCDLRGNPAGAWQIEEGCALSQSDNQE